MLVLLATARFLFVGRLVIFAANFRQIHGRLWQLHIHFFHRAGNDLRNGQIAEPLMVCRDDEPGGALGTRLSERILERLSVITPIIAFFVVRFTDLPLASRVIQSLLEPASCSSLEMCRKNLRIVVLFSVE